MSKKVKMEAIHSIQQVGVLHFPGKLFETSPKEAKRLISKGAAKLHRENETNLDAMIAEESSESSTREDAKEVVRDKKGK